MTSRRPWLPSPNLGPMHRFWPVVPTLFHFEVAVPLRNWQRPLYSAPDVLYFWPHQTAMHDFSMLYTAARFQDDTQDLASADYRYGYLSIDLKTCQQVD